MAGNLRGALNFFEKARDYSLSIDGGAELHWQRSVTWTAFTESDLLREAAWVVLCSGFRESVVRRVFGYVSLCFCDWESAASIIQAGSACRSSALTAFKNERKLQAIVEIALRVGSNDFASLKQRILDDPIVELQNFSHIGPITSFHLAKNLGLSVAKPDRHLVSLCERFGYDDASDLCRDLAEATGEQVKVVDLALWRYMADIRPAATLPLFDR